MDLWVSVFTKTCKTRLAGPIIVPGEATGGPGQAALVKMSHECWLKSGMQWDRMETLSVGSEQGSLQII